MKKIILIFVLFLLVGCMNKTKNSDIEHIEKQEDVNFKEEQEEVKLTIEDYQNNNVNELGDIPIMMYHGVQDLNNDDTKYTGGNVDKDGYQRTKEAFINDLEFYYNNGYRMIRLSDYIDGIINVELGKSPIILTFDDGLINNIKVIGLDNDGEIVIDPNCAVGILESFKEKYPDYNITATFFVNGGLFGQEEYNEKILKWLVDHGYDIGNHTYSHVDFSKVDCVRTQEEVGMIYEILDEIIPDNYVNIVALPFGSPYKLDHNNMNYIFETKYNNKNYVTKSTLRVGWEAESSPFSNDFNSKFLKRIRAYDNNGEEFDIKMNFEILEKNRYISDGNEKNIVVPKELETSVNEGYKQNIIFY